MITVYKAADFEIRLILSLSLSKTGPGDVSTCKLAVCCLKPDLKKSTVLQGFVEN